MKLTYVVTLEEMPHNFSACVPDVPGCVSTGRNWDEALEMIREALAFHLEAMMSDGELPPPPTTGIKDAIAHHSGPVPEDVLNSYAGFGDGAEAVATRFATVEVEISAPQVTFAG